MAQHSPIPIAFRYLSDKVRWELCGYSLAGRKSDFPEKPATFLGTDIPIPLIQGIDPLPTYDHWLLRLHRGKTIVGYEHSNDLFSVVSSEIEASFDTVDQLQRAGQMVPEGMSHLLVVFERQQVQQRELDPWRMRSEFMASEESNAALLGFLNRWGVWDGPSLLHLARPAHGNMRAMPLGSGPFCVLPSLVWHRRKALRDGMLGSADAWLTEDAALSVLHRRPTFPYFGITDRTCARAIGTTITLDHMRDVKSRLCARGDCGKVFTVESNHGQIYCEQYCGHLVSMRRNRAIAKLAKKERARKGV